MDRDDQSVTARWRRVGAGAAVPPAAAGTEAWLAARSPLALADRIAAPLLILQGAQDNIATVEEVELAHAAVTRRGTPCELRIFWDDTHALNRHTLEAAKIMCGFFARYLLSPQ